VVDSTALRLVADDRRDEESMEPTHQIDLRRMWFRLMRGPWSSIVVIPSDPSISAKTATEPLAQISRDEEFDPFLVLSGEGATVASGARLAKDLQAAVAAGTRVVATVDSVMTNLGGVALIRDAAAVLLVVRLGESRFDSINSTVDIVGRERVIGCAVLGPGHRRRWRPWSSGRRAEATVNS
jgi:hypothetical protein